MSRILIVEDEVAIADLEKDYLELSGFEVEIENRGDVGLKKALEGEYDLFILDLMLPEVDGFEICREIRNVKNTPIIILDEATAFTDPENEALIQSSVARLTKGKTLIVIAHRLSTITGSDRIFVVEDGNIRGTGTHEELLKKDKLYAEMWRSHIAVRDTAEGGAEV